MLNVFYELAKLCVPADSNCEHLFFFAMPSNQHTFIFVWCSSVRFFFGLDFFLFFSDFLCTSPFWSCLQPQSLKAISQNTSKKQNKKMAKKESRTSTQQSNDVIYITWSGFSLPLNYTRLIIIVFIILLLLLFTTKCGHNIL